MQKVSLSIGDAQPVEAAIPLVARRQGRNMAIRAVSLVAFLLVWWLLSLVVDKARVLPSPYLVAREFVSLLLGKSPFGSSYEHIGTTFYRLFVGFALGFVIGTVLGVLMGRVRRIYDFLENVAWILLCVPAVIWSFIFLLILGASNATAMGVTIALIAPKVMLNVAEGAKSFPEDLMEMGRSYGANTWMKVRDMFIPYLLPYFFSSARVGLSTGLQVVIVAELVGLNSGIGYVIDYWWREFFLGPILAWGLLLVLVGVLFEFGIFIPLEKKSKSWIV